MPRRRKYMRQARDLQRFRNDQARHFLDSIQTAETNSRVKRFGLYLRPFFSTNKLAAAPELPPRFTYRANARKLSPALPKPTDHIDYENVFLKALGPDCPLLAVGCIDDITGGAGRIIIAENEWRDRVADLISRAAIIILFPSAREGTYWELQFLMSSDAVARTAFIMPENPLLIPRDVPIPIEPDAPPLRHFVIGNTEERYFNVDDEWRSAIVAAQREGVALPPYAAGGALFTVDAVTRSVAWIDPMALTLSEDRAAYVAEVLAHDGLTPWRPPLTANPTIAYLEHISRYEVTAGMSLILLADGHITWGHFHPATGLLSDAMRIGKHSGRYAYNVLAALASRAHDSSLPPAVVRASAQMIIDVLRNADMHDDPLIQQAKVLLNQLLPADEISLPVLATQSRDTLDIGMRRALRVLQRIANDSSE